MLNHAVTPDSLRLNRLALVAVLAVTVWRVVWLAASKAELGVDEAQYWFWSQSLEWGYFSKPPVIAWIIRATTGLLGSDSPFAVRIASPLLQGATALLVMQFARDIAGIRTGALAGLLYLVMPAAMVGSMTISTDTPMLFFLALSLVLWLRLVRSASLWQAVLLGLAVGAAILSKYAMLFLLPGLVLAALSLPSWRLRRRDAAVVALSATLAVAPNLWWNIEHGFATLRHTASIAQWAGLQLHPGEGAIFLASQFAVFGPVFFGVILWQSARILFGRGNEALRGAVLLTLPVLVVMTGQALLSHAYANWAVGAAVGGSLLAALSLQTAPRLLAAALVLQGALAVALPMLPAVAIDLRLPNGQALFKRYTGRADVANFALDLARANGLYGVVAAERPLLADLFYQARDGGQKVFAAPQSGAPTNHYAMANALPDKVPGQILFLVDAVVADKLLHASSGIDEIGRITPGSGWALGRSFVALRVPAGFWQMENAVGTARGEDGLPLPAVSGDAG